MSGGHSYYKTINGVRYDRELLETAEKATKKGAMTEAAAKALWEDAEDGPGVTPTEHRTLEYIKDNFKLDPAAKSFLDGELGGRFVTIDGEKYKKSIIEYAAEADKCLSLADAKALWDDAMDEDEVDEVEKKSLEKVLKDHTFSKDGEEFLRTALDGYKGDLPLVGKRVQVHGVSRQDFNGKKGKAVSFSKEKNRYVVDLDGTKGEFRFKPDNLKLEEEGAETNSADLTTKIADLEKKVADAEKAQKEADKKASDAEAAKKDAEAKAADLTKKVKDAEAKAADLTKKVSDAEKAKGDAEKQAADLTKKVKDAEAKAADLNKQVGDLEKQVDALPEKLKSEIEKWEQWRFNNEKNMIAEFCAKEEPELKKARTS